MDNDFESSIFEKMEQLTNRKTEKKTKNKFKEK